MPDFFVPLTYPLQVLKATPSLSQAQRMKKLSQSGELNEDTMLGIMMEEKKPPKLMVTAVEKDTPEKKRTGQKKRGTRNER